MKIGHRRLWSRPNVALPVGAGKLIDRIRRHLFSGLPAELAGAASDRFLEARQSLPQVVRVVDLNQGVTVRKGCPLPSAGCGMEALPAHRRSSSAGSARRPASCQLAPLLAALLASNSRSRCRACQDKALPAERLASASNKAGRPCSRCCSGTVIQRLPGRPAVGG
jgi:hypothetical protein